MRKVTWLLVVVTLVPLGCGPRRTAVIADRTAVAAAPAPNLVLGPVAADTALALQFSGRDEWPVVSMGYLYDNQTFYTKMDYDYQMNFDRYNGLFYENQAVETGVWVR